VLNAPSKKAHQQPSLPAAKYMLKPCTNARELLVAPLVVGLVVALRVILASNTISEARCVEQLFGGQCGFSLLVP
jgi:hypothetical protein